jgi:hypothetical protein
VLPDPLTRRPKRNRGSSDGDHDCAEPGAGGRDAESAAEHSVCGTDEDWRGWVRGARHCALGVCGFERAGLPEADRYGNSRAEIS